jgi:magnesium chelatase subunit D
VSEGIVHFPFSAVVGQPDVKLALMLAAVDRAIGGVLLRGQKGSAKTTLARGLAALLGDSPFVELPLGTTEDRLVGSLDLAAALTGGGVRFQPGLLAAAHGGVLYVDEVNLLSDHLVDTLLDVAASGVNRVEREGVSHTHASRFVLVGSMNPEEGELRPQLLDRFGLAVDVAASPVPGDRAEAVRRRLAFDADPAGFCASWAEEESACRARLAAARSAEVSDGLLHTISALCAAVGAEGLRADLVITRAAAARAGLEGRARATVDDVRAVAPLALAHRRRRQPFDEPGIAPEELDRALQDARGDDDEAENSRPPQEDEPDKSSSDGLPGEERTAAANAPTAVVPLEAPRSHGGGAGRRSMVEDVRGRLVGDRVPGPIVGSVAVAATVRAAAGRQAGAAAEGGGRVSRSEGAAPALDIERGDLREAVRQRRAGNLVILTVDASGSMGAERRMEAAKGAVLSLLLDAYQRRDRVALITFRDGAADVVLRPTGSVEVARARLGQLPTGGRTPLAAGISAAARLAENAGQGAGDHRPLLVLVSDGRATEAPDGADPLAAAVEAAAGVKRRGIPAVVVDAEEGPHRLGLAAELARAMGARYLPVGKLSAGALAGAVRDEIPAG